jgi:hypothetical protein
MPAYGQPQWQQQLQLRQHRRERGTDYHRRSLVETKMNGIKRLGERVMSRTFERQVNELHIRAAILNRFTELGRAQTAALA